jgi:hypothetical protein
MASIITFRNRRGDREILSYGALKRDLMLLENTTIEAIPDFSTQDNSLLGVFDKIGIESNDFSTEDVVEIFRNFSDEGERITTAIFSMSRPHFLAMVYLLYVNRDPARIAGIVDLDYRTRTVALLDYLETSKTQNSVLERSFESYLSGFLHTSNDREPEAVPAEMYTSDYGLITETTRNIQQRAFKYPAVPSGNLGYLTYLAMIETFAESEPPSLRTFIYDNFHPTRGNVAWNIGNAGSLGGYGYNLTNYGDWRINYREKDFDPRASLAIDIKSSYYNYLDFSTDKLTGVTRNNLSKPSISTDSFNSFLVETALSESAIKIFSLRSFYYKKESAALQPILDFYPIIDSRSKMAASYALSDQASKPFFPKLLQFAFLMYNNSAGISVSGDVPQSIYTDSGSTLRSVLGSAGNAPFDFSYISDEGVRTFIRELMPEAFSGFRSSELFILSTMTTRLVNPNGVFIERTTPTIDRQLASALAEFDVYADKDREIVTLGPASTGLRGFAMDSFRRALATAGYNESDLLSLSSYESSSDSRKNAKFYINDLKGKVVQAIIAQRFSPNTQNHNENMRRGSPNVLNRYFLAEFVDRYFDFVIDTKKGTGDFRPTLSLEAMKHYRLLNFIKHSIINIQGLLFLLQYGDATIFKLFTLMIVSLVKRTDFEQISNIALNVRNEGEYSIYRDLRAGYSANN